MARRRPDRRSRPAGTRRCCCRSRAGVNTGFHKSLLMANGQEAVDLWPWSITRRWGLRWTPATPPTRARTSPNRARPWVRSVKHVHLRDGRGKNIMVVPGDGDVDFAELAAALREIGYGRAAVIELEYADAHAPQVRPDLARAKRSWRSTLSLPETGRITVGSLRLHGAKGVRATMNPIGVNAWVWVSPPTDANIAEIAPRVKAMGFDLLELGVGVPGRLGSGARRRDPGRQRPGRLGLRRHGRRTATSPIPTSSPPRRTTSATASTRPRPSGANVVAGPLYTPVGKTWQMDGAERAATVDRLVEGLRAARRLRGGARRAPRRRAAQPLRDELPQHRRADDGGRRSGRLPGGRGAARHVPHEHRGEGPGRGHPPRRRQPGPLPRLRQRPRHAGRRPHRLGGDRHRPEGDGLRPAPWSSSPSPRANQTIARAAAIWRPLAETQDALAEEGLAFLRGALR